MEFIMFFEDWLIVDEAIQQELAIPFDDEHYTRYEGGYISNETIEELKYYHGFTDEDINQMMIDIAQNEKGGGTAELKLMT